MKHQTPVDHIVLKAQKVVLINGQLYRSGLLYWSGGLVDAALHLCPQGENYSETSCNM